MVEGLPAAVAAKSTVAPAIAAWLAGDVTTTGNPDVGSPNTVTSSNARSTPIVWEDVSLKIKVVFVEVAVKSN
jgi:hypothetical protein